MRDAVDNRIIDIVKNGSFSFEGSEGGAKGIIDSQKVIGGWPELKRTNTALDSDGDGMSVAWEIEKKLDSNVKNANRRNLSSVYDNIEVFLNGIVKDVNAGQYD